MKRLIIVISLVSSLNSLAGDHPYSITFASAEIGDRTVSVIIKTNAEDLLYFHRLPMDSMLQMDGRTLRGAAKAHVQKILNGFFILDQNGTRLPSVATELNLRSLEEVSSVPVMHLLKYPLYYQLEFTLEEKTSLLAFHQVFSDEGIPAVSLLSISKGGNELVRNIELSKEKPFIMARDAISIGHPGGAEFLVSYITLSDTRILHELTLPAALLRTFVQFDTSDLKSAEAAISRFIKDNSEVIVNKKEIVPQLTLLEFHRSGDYNEAAVVVNIRVEYSPGEFPTEARLTWDAYNWRMRWFKSVIDAFGKTGEHHFSRFQRSFEIRRDPTLKTRD